MIDTSYIPGVSVQALNQIVRNISRLESFIGLEDAVELFFSTINTFLGTSTLPVLLSNETGGLLTKGTLVYVSGVDANGVQSVTKADADSPTKPAQYVLTEDLAAPVGSTGYGTGVGLLTGFDTSAFLVDDILYLSATAGGVTKTAPTGADQVVQSVGVVEAVGVSGAVYFWPGLSILERAGTSFLQAGTLSAAAAGRALMAAGFFDVATALDKWATDSIENAWLIQVIKDGSFAADSATQALFANLFMPDAKLAQDRGKTAGVWVGFTGGSTDITGGAATREIGVNIDGAGNQNLSIAKGGLNTGPLIAAAIQVAIRAIATGGYTLAECRYDAATGRYLIASGTRGTSSSVAVIAGSSNDLATSLKLLVADNAVAFPGCGNLDHARAQAAALLATLDTTALLRALGTDQITNAVLLQAVPNGAFAADDATRALFAANFLGNTAIGRALMQTGFFDATKVLDAFAVDSMANAALIQIIADGAYQADAATRALFADLIWTDAKLNQDRGKTSAMVVGYVGGSTDISAGAGTRDINVTIDGTGPINVQITGCAAYNTAAKIATALQAAIRAANAAFAAAEVRYDIATQRYMVTTGTRGSATAVTLAAGTGADVGADLCLLAANNAETLLGTDNLDQARAQASGLFARMPDAGSYYTSKILATMLQEIVAGMGGASTTVRAYSSATSYEPVDNAPLTAALGSEMLTRRDEFAQLLLDETSPPTATAGRGLVVSGGVVAPQGAPDLTVSVTALDAYNQAGRRVKPAQVLILSGFTIPAGGGEERRDIVVCDASGTIVRRVGSEGAPTQPDATLTAGDVPLARVVLTQGVDTNIQAGNITDLRQTAKSIDPTKILAGILPALITLAQGRTLAGNAAGVAAPVDIHTLGAVLAGDGADAVMVNLLTAALGGTTFSARAYSGGSLGEPVDDSTLTAAIGALMLLERYKFANLVLDSTDPPTATAGRGFVAGCAVTQHGGGDNTVDVAVGKVISGQGRYGAATAGNVAATTPNGLGGTRYDIVVIPAGGGLPVIREGTVITTDPVLTLGDTPLARLQCAPGAFTILAANIDDLRQTEPIYGARITDRTTDYTKLIGTASVANVPAGGVATLNGIGTYSMAPAGAGAWNLDSIAGLNDGDIAWLTISDITKPCTIRDNATGGGNIWTRYAQSLTLAALADGVLVQRDGARYRVLAAVIQAGVASQAAGTGNTGAPSADNTGSVTETVSYPVRAPGGWAIDGDGAETNGGGLVGHVAVLTQVANAEHLVYDAGTGEYEPIEVAGATWRTVNYQVLPDTPANGDAMMIMFDKPFPEFAIDMNTLATYTGVCMTPQVSTGTGTWTNVTTIYDNSNVAVHTGDQPMARDGATVMIPEATWAPATYGGKTGYWFRYVVADATKIGVVGATNNKRAEIVTAEEGWTPPQGFGMDSVSFADVGANVHAANAVKLLLWDQTSGQSRVATFAINKRQELAAITAWTLTTAARISTWVVQEDGTNEPVDALYAFGGTWSHAHGPGIHTHPGPSHSHLT